MSDSQTNDVSRGLRAAQLLNDEMMTETFATLEAEYIKAWRESGPRDNDGRERLWQAIQIVGKVKSHLQSIAAGGKLAQRELDDLASKRVNLYGPL